MPDAGRPGAAAIGLAGALSLAVAMGIGRFSFTPLLPLMIAGGQVDLAGGGWLAAANYLGYLLGAMSAWRLGLAPMALARLALALTALLAAAMALPLGLAGWAAVRLAAGMASAWAFVATSTWCLQALARRDAAGWSSALYAGVGSGIALAGLHVLAGGIAGASATSLWLQVAAVAAALSLAVAGVIRRMGPDGAPPAASSAASSSPATAPAPASGLRGLIACYGLFGFGYILPATFLPALARLQAPDPRLFGLAWPVFGLTAAVSVIVAARWLRDVPRLRLWAASQGLMGLGVLLPSLSPSGAAIALSALLVGGTFMVATLAGLQEARARAGEAAPRVLARMTTAFALGQIAGPLASNALLWWPGLGEAGALRVALQLGAVSLVGSAGWLWRVGRRL